LSAQPWPVEIKVNGALALTRNAAAAAPVRVCRQECDANALRAKLSYTNLGFALAPDEFTISELRDLYAAALGHDVSATNLQRVLLRREVLEPTGRRRASGPTGGRPGSLFRFRTPELEITDPVRRAAPARTCTSACRVVLRNAGRLVLSVTACYRQCRSRR